MDPGSHAGIPGPVDRESFFEAQRRHRRATWRLSALCAVAAVVMGRSEHEAQGELLYALVLLVAHLIDLLAPLPDGFWQATGALASLVMKVIGGLLGEDELASLTQTLLGLAAMLVPGALAMVLIWLGLSSLFLRAGVGGVLLTLGAREPRADDPEERQLANVAEEMAVARGFARRYLADATAVQLTRYPDGLARALEKLAGQGATIPGGGWAAHLFMIGPEGLQGEGRDAVEEGGVAAGSLLAFHPPLKRRLKRLRSLGAGLAPDEEHLTRRRIAGNVLAVLVLGPLVVLVAGALLFLVAIVIGLDLLFMGIALVIIHGLFSLL